MIVRFLRYENSERIDAWSADPEFNLQVPRVGDEVESVTTTPGNATEGKNVCTTVFLVKRVIWNSRSVVTVMIQERIDS